MIHVQDAVLFEKLLCWDRRTKRMLCVHIVGLQAVADLVGNGMQSWLMVRSWFVWLVTRGCG